MSYILDDNAHAVAAVIIREVTHDPYTGMVHLNNRGNAFCGSQPEHWNFDRRWDRVAVDRDDFETVSRQREAANFSCTTIQHVKEHPLTLFDPHRFPMPQHPAIDREIAIAHFITVRHAFREGCFHPRFAARFQFFDPHDRNKKILSHVPALTERWFKFFENEKDLAVIVSRLARRLDVNSTDLPAVLSEVEVGTAANMRVIEPET